MGLFDRFKGTSSNAGFSLQEATGGVLLSVVGSDGNISDEEVELFNFIANRHPIFREQSAADFRRTIDKMVGILNREGWRPLVDRCGADIPDEFKPTVFALAVDCILADGSVEEKEKEVISELQASLRIEDRHARQIIDVLAVKNGL